MSMRRGTTDLRAYPFFAASPPASTAALYWWNRRPPLLAIYASACIEHCGSVAATFGYPAISAVLGPASDGLVFCQSLDRGFRSFGIEETNSTRNHF
ncbi:hypothetical protein XH94_29790 [Bradyrhizobium zhanjiangense]|uniref:Uncharacterized protein n=1 Tax=Bradyrhizobium zhanjiangense TaxID=1325107 RepID=A0A4Q0SDJ1_9BRAD|nr:hypothetical protein XH94_29790 [Bradyrhizobium zhanjiangense]